LVLDIVISIDRLKNNFALPDTPLTTDFQTPESILAIDIICKIEKHFFVTYNNIELSEITVIISSSLIKTDFETITMENIEHYVEPVCISLIEPLRNQLANYDFIDVNNLKFMTRFVLHINNLLLRLKNQYIRKNPLTENIKTSCPMLFECAIALSDIINQETGYQVSEHEAAYIAMHIGSLLSGHPSMKDKVTCILLFPPYYDFGEKLVAQLTDSFGSSLVIKNIITYSEELKTIDTSIDLVISIVNISDFYSVEFVHVSPFLTRQDFGMVLKSVERIKLKKKKARLYEELQQISKPAIFFRDMPFNKEDEVIRFMSAMMTENGYVEKTFCDEVLLREHSYSTAYGNIAVPHSMRLSAKKTGMAVLINEKPVPWGKQAVNVVLLFSIQREDRSLFYDIFDNLIVLLLEAANVTKIMSCKTYEEFIKNIINCL
jgi:lichenan operon transcriptional antiterminator